MSISIFSKHLHWLNYKDMASLVADMGFDGIDLTVRPGGHVTPENASRDLPKAVEVIQRAGLKVHTITTDIKAADQPYTVDILKAASQSGITNYRMGWYNYNREIGVMENIAVFKKDFVQLAALNEKYKIQGNYQNHTERFGNSIWDLWLAINNLNPTYLSTQFDVRHAIIDGAEAWPIHMDLIKTHIGSIAIKDFSWKKTNNKWLKENAPLGQGMVDFKKYFSLIKKYDLKVPVSLHYEYPLGGAEKGATSLSITKDEFIKAVQGDLETLKGWLKTEQLI
jgi:L-ribulose-5-phosphate 3-epimerase